LSPYTIFLKYPHINEVHRGKLWASGSTRNMSTPPDPDVREFLIQGFAHRLAKKEELLRPSTEPILNLSSCAAF
jgi:hypothetical protein